MGSVEVSTIVKNGNATELDIAGVIMNRLVSSQNQPNIGGSVPVAGEAGVTQKMGANLVTEESKGYGCGWDFEPPVITQEMIETRKRIDLELAAMDSGLNPNPLTPTRSSARVAYREDIDKKEALREKRRIIREIKRREGKVKTKAEAAKRQKIVEIFMAFQSTKEIAQITMKATNGYPSTACDPILTNIEIEVFANILLGKSMDIYEWNKYDKYILLDLIHGKNLEGISEDALKELFEKIWRTGCDVVESHRACNALRRIYFSLFKANLFKE